MNEELLLVAIIIGGIGLMIAGIVFSQRGYEKKLRAQSRIELHFDKPIRVVICIVAPLIIGSLVNIAVLKNIDDPKREHALAAVLFCIGNIAVEGAMAFFLTRGRFRKGTLSIDEHALALTMNGQQESRIDLQQPFVLSSFLAFMPNGIQQEVLFVQQEGREVAFSYGLPIGRKPIGTQLIDRSVNPQLGSAGRIIHERLLSLSPRGEGQGEGLPRSDSTRS